MRFDDPKISAVEGCWALAVERENIVRPLAQKATLTPDDIAKACKHLGIKRALLYRLIDRYSKDQRASSLLPRKRGRPEGHSSLPPESSAIIENTIHSYYMTAQKPRVSKLLRMVSAEARKAGIPCPSRKAVERRIKTLDLKTLIAKREGRVAAIYHTTWQGISGANGYPYIGDYDLKDDTIEFLSALTSIDTDKIRRLDPARRFPFAPVTRFLCHPVTGKADSDFCTECFRDDLYFGRDNYIRLEWALAGVQGNRV